jgi:hypothetical protein
MAKMKILFKGGQEITICCDEFTVTKSNLTSEITNIKWKGLKNIKPMYCNFSEMLCVYQVLETEED